jgi:hypothetical protein
MRLQRQSRAVKLFDPLPAFRIHRELLTPIQTTLLWRHNFGFLCDLNLRFHDPTDRRLRSGTTQVKKLFRLFQRRGPVTSQAAIRARPGRAQ